MIFTILKGPFRYHASGQQILDANNNVVINLAAWHVLQHHPDGLHLMAELGEATAYALNRQFSNKWEGMSALQIMNDIQNGVTTFQPGCE